MNRRIGRWDDIVVGGGLLGAAVARRLVESGRRVAIAERGQAVTSPAGSHVRNTAAMQASPDTYFADIDRYLDYIDTDVAGSGLPGAFTTSVRGGVAIVWTNNCPRSISGIDRPELPRPVGVGRVPRPRRTVPGCPDR
jgi:choline dehydrogenase-like flavoprotein